MVDTVQGKASDDEQIQRIAQEAVARAMGVYDNDDEYDRQAERLNRRIDERVNTKIDKLKVWFFGGVLVIVIANFAVPMQLSGRLTKIETVLDNLSVGRDSSVSRVEFEAHRLDVTRRLDENSKRVTSLEVEARR